MMKKKLLGIVFGALVFPTLTWAIIPSDSTSDILRNWWNTRQLHNRAHVCMATVAPSTSVTSPHVTVLRRDTWEASEMQNVPMKNCYYTGNGSSQRELYVYCGPNTSLRVKVAPRVFSSAFSLRSVQAYNEDVVPGTTSRVWGFYCTSTGCYGARLGGTGLNGVAAVGDFEMDVIAYCLR